MKSRAILGSMLLITVLLPGCDGGGAIEGGSDGALVGIVFRNGTECLGDGAQPLDVTDVYVSPSGDDEAAGTPAAPLHTLAHALCNAVPGQTVHVLPGVYHESVILGAFGSAPKAITVKGESVDGQSPVLDGEGSRTMGIALVESTNWTIEGLTFRKYTDEGLHVLLGEGIHIENNAFVDNGRASINPDYAGEGFGINVVGTRNVTIANNEAFGNGPSQERVGRAILGTGIDTFELDGAVIRGNHSHDNTGGGLLVEDGVDVLVEENVIEANELDANGDYWDGGIWVDGGHDVTVRANTLTNNHGPGLEISDEDSRYPDASYGYVVERNVITDNLYGIYVWNFGQCPAPDEGAVRFVENVVEGNSVQDVWCVE